MQFALALTVTLPKIVIHCATKMSWRHILSRVAVLKYLAVAPPLTFCAKASIPTQEIAPHTLPRQHFVVIGLGTAGAAATREILKHGDDTDKILLVDPHARLKLQYFGLPLDPRISLADASVQDIDHVHRILRLSNGAKVHFEQCLIAVGSAAPALNALYVDPTCDVTATLVDLTHLNAPYELNTTITGSQPTPTYDGTTPQRAVLPGKIALLGANCWETVHLAGKLAISVHQHEFDVTDTQQTPKESNRTVDTNGRSAAPVTLIYPAYGPLSHSLPRYLSLALARRLSQTGVNLMPYTHVRYLDGDGAASQGVPDQHAPGVVLYTAKTYDSLNTQSMKFQKIAFAPTAVPTRTDAKEYYATLRAADGTDAEPSASVPQRRPHVHEFILRSGLEIERQSGGIAVNQSLQACEGIYAAGDIANVYLENNRTSCVDLSENMEIFDTPRDWERRCHSRVIQQRGIVRGYANAAYSGTVAGRNMVVSTHRSCTDSESKALIYTHTPVYHASGEEMGVYFTFIGNCSSALESHGFWWRLDENSKPVSTVHNINKCGKAIKPTVASEGEAIKPPLGLGVVFYMDGNVVVGVLISGLPLADSTSDTGDSVGDAHIHNAYSDAVQEIATSLIGQSAQKLGAYSHGLIRSHNQGKGNSVGKADKLMFEVDVGAEVLKDRPTSTITPQPAQDQSLPGTSSHHADVVDNSGMGESAVLLQALSVEARRVISPLLSAHLYTDKLITEPTQHYSKCHTPGASTNSANNSEQRTLPHTEQLYCAIQSYPRPLYRYGSASHTTYKDLSESVARSVIRPVQLREGLFQPENVNTGSKTDNLYAAFKKKLIHGQEN